MLAVTFLFCEPSHLYARVSIVFYDHFRNKDSAKPSLLVILWAMKALSVHYKLQLWKFIYLLTSPYNNNQNK